MTIRPFNLLVTIGTLVVAMEKIQSLHFLKKFPWDNNQEELLRIMIINYYY